MILRISSALVCLLFVVSTASAQCSSCAQGPVFNQGVSAPVYYNSVAYAQPVSQMQVAYAVAPAQSACGSCGQTAAAMPVNSGCSSCCGQSVMAQPACGTYTSAPVNTGCCGQSVMAQPACGACTAAPVNAGCSSCVQPTCRTNECASSGNGLRTRVLSIGSRRNSRCCCN